MAGTNNVAVGLRFALDTYGVTVLDDPQRLLKVLEEVCDVSSDEMRLLASNCDTGLFAPLAQAAQDGSAEAVVAAMDQLIHVLIDQRGLDVGMSQRVVLQLAAGLREHLDASSSSPTASKTPKPPSPVVGVSPGMLAAADGNAGGVPKSRGRLRIALLACLYTVLAVAFVATAIALLSRTIMPRRAGSSDVYTLRFLANGGTGEMKNVMAAAGSEVSLPECDFSYEGHTFVCWYDQEGGRMAQPGEKWLVDDDVTFRAQWHERTGSLPERFSKQDIEEVVLVGKLADQVQVERFDFWRDQDRSCMVMVLRNTGDRELDVYAQFTTYDRKGAVVETWPDYCNLKAGSQEILWDTSYDDGETAGVSCTIEVRESDNPGIVSLTVEEVNVTDEYLTLRVTNNTDQTVRSAYVTVYGVSDTGYNYTIEGHWDPKTFKNVPLKPGESWTIELESNCEYRSADSYSNQPWTKLERHVNATGYADL